MAAERPDLDHPRLRAGLALALRDDGELQVGAGVAARRLHGVDAGLLPLLHRMDGTQRLEALRALDPRAPEVVRVLAAQGLLEPRRVPSPGTVLLLGAGSLGRALAHRLTPTGVGLLLCDPEPPAAGLYDGPPRPDAAGALRAELVASHPVTRRAHRPRVLGHWSQLLELSPGAAEPDVVVVAADRAECDRAVTDTLLRRDLPHLLVRPLDGGAQVGPFVLPGTDSCTRCTDLYRCGGDPRWPVVLAQLIRQTSRPDPVAVDWAACTAVVQVLAALHGHRPELCGHTLELETRSWSTRLRRWPPHPACGCDLSVLEP